MDIPDDEDGFPYTTSIWAAFGLSTISGWAIMGTLVAAWIRELHWWALLLAPPLALLAGLLALPALRDVRVRMAVTARVCGSIPRAHFKSTSDWLAFRFYETWIVMSFVFISGMAAGWWALLPFTLVAILRMRWLTVISVPLAFLAIVGLVEVWDLFLRS
jgi:hypothetical protein